MFSYLVSKLFFSTFPTKFRFEKTLNLTDWGSRLVPALGPSLWTQGPGWPLWIQAPDSHLTSMDPGSRLASVDPDDKLLLMDPGSRIAGYLRHKVSCLKAACLLACQKSLAGLIGEGLSLLKPIYNTWKRWLFLEIHRPQYKITRITKKQRNMISPKETKKALVTDPKE